MEATANKSERSQQKPSERSMQDGSAREGQIQGPSNQEVRNQTGGTVDSRVGRANSATSKASRASNAGGKASEHASSQRASEKMLDQRSRGSGRAESAEEAIQKIFDVLQASAEVSANGELAKNVAEISLEVKRRVSGQRLALEQQQTDMTEQINQQQEQFFIRMQEKEDELEEMRAKVEQIGEGKSLLLQEAEGDPVNEAGNAEQVSYEQEERYAQQRKLANIKFTKTATKLQGLLERNLSDQGKLEQRVEGVELLQGLSAIMTTQMQENKNLQLGRIKKESKVKSLQENITFLEGRLTAMLTEKEEQAIKLKSEVIIYKQKAKQYKGQMLEQQEQYRTGNETVLAERVQLSKQEFVGEMEALRRGNLRLRADVQRLGGEKQELADRNQEFEKEYVTVVADKDEVIQRLRKELDVIEEKHKRANTRVQNRRDEAQRKLAIEEKERELYGLKLEQVMVNNKKLVLQKKFLEKQLEKDRREIHLEMNKIQIEIQQDQLMNSSSALQRFRGVYQAVSDQLAYVEQIVGFMDFDQEGAPGGTARSGAPPGHQPPSFEDVAKEINEKFPQGPRPGSGQLVTSEQAHLSSDDGRGGVQHSQPGAAGLSVQSHSVTYDGAQDAGSGMVGMTSDNLSQPPINMAMNINQTMSPNLGPMMAQPPMRRNGNTSQHAGAAMRGQGQQPLPRGPMGAGPGGQPQQALLTVDECFASYPNELLYALLEMLNENFQDAKIHQSEHIARLLELVQGQVDRSVVREIFDKFLLQHRIQFSQYLFKLSEKQKALEIERKNLQFKVQRAKLDMQRIEQSEQNQQQNLRKQKQREEGSQQEVEDEEPHQHISEEVVDDDGARSGTVTGGPSRGTSQRVAEVGGGRHQEAGEGWNSNEVYTDHDPDRYRTTLVGGRALAVGYRGAEPGAASPAVPGNLHNPLIFELEQQVDILKQENVALKERCKEIRLNLQRRITELQDTLTISRQRYLTELSELKVEYGKDLNRITRSSKEKTLEVQKQFDAEKDVATAELHKEFALKEAELKGNIEENERRAQQAIEEAEINVRDAERDLKKLKKESTGYFKGGWGTFIIAFEGDEAVVEEHRSAGGSARGVGHSQGNAPGQSHQARKAAPKKGKKKATPNTTGKSRGGSKDASLNSSHVSQNLAKLDTMVHPHPIETISHFVEVGFLLDRNNFRLLNTFEEATYDSNLKKYLYELQDPIDNFQMNDLEFKMKQQLTDNVGLFNEINPVYISMNMGRPSTPFLDEYVAQDQFRLIQREGVYLMGDRWMMINFLKSDGLSQLGNADSSQQHQIAGISHDTNINDSKERGKTQMQYTLRVIAFENETSSQFTFDLNFNDLLTLMEGNIKLLEDENTHDLCQILLNNLTMIKREKVDKKGNAVHEDVLIVEHKVFFSERHRAIYDKKNKHIMAKYDKQRQGLVQDVALSTDYEKSVIYEAFTHVFEDQVTIQSTQRQDAQEVLAVEILRGKMSGNIRLRVTFLNHGGTVREMCLFAEAQQRSHKVCSEIVHLGNGPSRSAPKNNDHFSSEGVDSSTLAFVVSLEKLYGMEDILVVRLVLLEKWNENAMLDYSWTPEGRPQEGSTQFNSQTLYLVKKSDAQYCQVTEYEILNTEIRTQLFMHSYGYIQANVDFGNIRRYLEHGEERRVNYLSVLGSEEYMRDALNVNIKAPAEITDFKGLNQLIYRQFCIIRLRDQLIQSPSKIRPGQATERPTLHQVDLEPPADEQEHHERSPAALILTELIDQEESYTNYHALVAIFDDGQCLERGELMIKVVIQEEGIDVIAAVEILPEVMPIQKLREINRESSKIELCSAVIDKLVLSEFEPRHEGEFRGAAQQERQFLLTLDKDIQPMSEYVAEVKQQKFEEMLRHEEGRDDDGKVQMELRDVASLKIALTALAGCQKTSQMTLLNQKVYKVTAYFVKGQKEFEPKLPQSQRMFDWQFVYIEVAQRSSDHQIVFAVTEKDLVSILQKLRQKMRVSGKDLNRELVQKSMSREAILNLILDCFLMNAETYEVSLSMLHLHSRYVERCALEEKFIITGGRFISMKDGQDPELTGFKTGVPPTELTKRLIQNVQKDMSDKTFDVKIYELELRSLPGAKKIRFEIFWVDAPDIVFRCDMFSSANQEGSQIIMEKINIVEQLEQLKLEKRLITEDQYDPTKFAKDGLVLAICESSFPHQISFMLIEPCSHIQWEFSYFDEKLNVIETRQQRLNFVSNLREVLAAGILRDTTDDKRAHRIAPGEQQLVGEEQAKDTFYCLCVTDDVLANERPGNPFELIYAQSLEVTPGQYRNLTLVSDCSNDKIIVRLAPIGDASANRAHKPDALNLSDIHVSLNSQMEGSRVVSGCIQPNLDGGSRKNVLLYTVEIACALKHRERAIRFSLFDQVIESPLVSVVFIDKAIFDDRIDRMEMKPDTAFAIKSGFTDSLAIVQKMTCLNYDYQRYELTQEVNMKLKDSKSVDLMRDFKDQGQSQDAGASRDSSKLKRASKDEDSAFVSLAKLKERLLQRSMKNNLLLYRKVMRLDKGRKNVTISALREENHLFVDESRTPETEKAGRGTAAQRERERYLQQNKYLVKLVLFENKRLDNSSSIQAVTNGLTSRSRDEAQSKLQPAQQSASPPAGPPGRSQAKVQGGLDRALQGMPKQDPVQGAAQSSREYVFVFSYQELFTPQEMAENEVQDLTALKRLVATAMNRRLRVREIPDALDLGRHDPGRRASKRGVAEATPTMADAQGQHLTRYIAFFLDEKQINALPKNPSIQKLDLLEGSNEFDIRQLHSFALMSPGKKLLPPETKEARETPALKQNLIYQFEKDDLLFEVLEVLNPSELAFRLKVYERSTFKMLTSCEVAEAELRAELTKDKRTYLTGPQQREELAKYLITNSYYDDGAQSLHFMISDLVEDM